MKHIILFILLASSIQIEAQQIEYFGGLNHNLFRDSYTSNNYLSSEYGSEIGFSFGLGFHQLNIGKHEIKARLSYERVGGSLNAIYLDGINGQVFARVRNSIINLTLYPLNKTFDNRIGLSLGFDFSRIFRESFSGFERFETNTPGVIMEEDIQSKYSIYSTRHMLGLRALISYDIPLNDNVSLSPQYTFHFGLTNETENFIFDTFAMRHFMGLGIKQVLSSKNKEKK